MCVKVCVCDGVCVCSGLGRRAGMGVLMKVCVFYVRICVYQSAKCACEGVHGQRKV